MQIGRIFDIFGAIVGVALAFVVVSSPHTSQIIGAWGSAFSGSLHTSMGH